MTASKQSERDDPDLAALRTLSERATAGPWITAVHFQQRYGGRTYWPILRPGNDPVPIGAIHIEVDGHGRDEGMANARLATAAVNYVRAALAKADTETGE